MCGFLLCILFLSVIIIIIMLGIKPNTDDWVDPEDVTTFWLAIVV